MWEAAEAMERERVSSKGGSTSVLDNVNYVQKTYSNTLVRKG